MMRYYRFSLHLPEYRNPVKGRRVKFPEGYFAQTATELAAHFGAGTWRRNCAGIWFDRDGTVYVDPRMRIFIVDTPERQRSLTWLRRHIKSVLLLRFEQKAIYLTVEKLESFTIR